MPKTALAPDEINPSLPGTGSDPARKDVLRQIKERTEQIESSPAWIENSYEGLRIRSLRNVSSHEYSFYKSFLDNGTVYIIVHPAYYTFFNSERIFGPPGMNAVERFLAEPANNARMAVLQAQERRMRDFLEYKSTEKKLIILILPRGYKNFSGYAYRGGPDEYTRFINDVTNESDSVLYLESRSPMRGYLKDDDLAALIDFLAGVNPDRILIGGGYIGRCLENFYVSFTDDFGINGVYLVPELSDVSPSELNSSLASRLLAPNGDIDNIIASEAMKHDVYRVQNIAPKVFDLK
ncbi:MAG: hypothetical protein M0Z59_01330 [Nitrospiraceae bacterium]|nr:hypothetical protein [Nitrospiraceae bacterium]